MDNALLAEGRITSQFGEINELISPAQNHYNSFFVQRVSDSVLSGAGHQLVERRRPQLSQYTGCV
jgi:hypothetical protein